ncbi:MAG: DsbA family protein, partial [Burkholderiales bacterium]|nr:DsbA family protein [Burkholderiales bacterium]
MVSRPTARALALLALLTACADRYARPPRCPSPATTAPTPSVALRDSERVPVADAPRAGPADAPVTVVVVSDFECPHCARGRVIAADLRAMFPAEVRVVWRNLPAASHGHARAAAEAAMEVRAQRGDEAFWRFHDIVFAHQDALGREDLERYAARVGADLPRLRAALDERLHASAVDGDVALAERLGVDA